jgi:hypothetical protein
MTATTVGIHARDPTGFYGLDRVWSNEDRLHSVEADIGTDTLRLVRLSEIATVSTSLPKQSARRDGSPTRPGSRPPPTGVA